MVCGLVCGFQGSGGEVIGVTARGKMKPKPKLRKRLKEFEENIKVKKYSRKDLESNSLTAWIVEWKNTEGEWTRDSINSDGFLFVFKNRQWALRECKTNPFLRVRKVTIT